jgi:protein gp37
MEATMGTKIEWCTETWNPVVGCSKISTGCLNCYAERMANRLAYQWEKRTWTNVPPESITAYHSVVGKYKEPDGIGTMMCGWTGRTVFVKSALEKPLHWRKSKMIFVCSMGDLFHESVPFAWIDEVIAVASLCPQHIFMLLTKRPKNMMTYFSPENPRYSAGKVCDLLPDGFGGFDPDINWPPNNLWIGVTAETQARVAERIPVLLKIPAARRFVSIEPMLGPVDISGFLPKCSYFCDHDIDGGGHRPGQGLDWVICGGETGPGARAMDLQWARDLRDQCTHSRVPFFFKKVGGGTPTPEDLMVRETPESVTET